MIKKRHGFSLVEMAIVLTLVGLLLGTLVIPMSKQVEQKRITDTRKYLDAIKDTLVIYAATHGRLPCPASGAANATGKESFAVGGDASNGLCSNFYDGFLPAVDLGMTPTDNQGYAVDAWGIQQNRIHYAVYSGTINGVTNPFTRSNGMASAGMANLAATIPLLSVCNSATGITTTTCGTATKLTETAPVVVYSVGPNGATGGTGLDEKANPNPNSTNSDPVFVSHDPTGASAANGAFDDIVTWISLSTLFSSMMTAGALP